MIVNIPSWTVDFAVCGFWFLCGFVLAIFLGILTERDIIGLKIDEVLKKLKKIEQDITVNNINEMRRDHKNAMRRG